MRRATSSGRTEGTQYFRTITGFGPASLIREEDDLARKFITADGEEAGRDWGAGETGVIEENEVVEGRDGERECDEEEGEEANEREEME